MVYSLPIKVMALASLMALPLLPTADAVDGAAFGKQMCGVELAAPAPAGYLFAVRREAGLASGSFGPTWAT